MIPCSSTMSTEPSGAVQYLIAQGHSEIGYLSSKVMIRNFHERQDGWLRGIQTIPVANDSRHHVVKVSPTADGAFRDMTAYLQLGGKLPTAFFADNDLIAISCARALRAAGYRIPEDVSLIGVDGHCRRGTAGPAAHHHAGPHGSARHCRRQPPGGAHPRAGARPCEDPGSHGAFGTWQRPARFAHDIKRPRAAFRQRGAVMVQGSVSQRRLRGNVSPAGCRRESRG